jgi:hypothetical protein
MPAAEETDEELLRDRFLPDDHAAELLAKLGNLLVQAVDGFGHVSRKIGRGGRPAVVGVRSLGLDGGFNATHDSVGDKRDRVRRRSYGGD